MGMGMRLLHFRHPEVVACHFAVDLWRLSVADVAEQRDLAVLVFAFPSSFFLLRGKCVARLKKAESKTVFFHN